MPQIVPNDFYKNAISWYRNSATKTREKFTLQEDEKPSKKLPQDETKIEDLPF